MLNSDAKVRTRSRRIGARPGFPLIVVGLMSAKIGKYIIGQIVRHRVFPFRGVIFDVDPEFANTEEWYQAIPAEIRPRKDQPFYHLLAENAETTYLAYVSEQNLLPDDGNGPVRHPMVKEMFEGIVEGRYQLKRAKAH